MKIRVVSADDWSGLYINDKLYRENHTLSSFMFIEALKSLGVDAASHWIEGELDEFGNRLPEDYNELKIDG